MAPTPDDPVGAPPVDSPETADEPGGRVTVVLPLQRRAEPVAQTRRSAPMPVVAVVNAVWAALLSYLPILVVVGAVTLPGPGHTPIGGLMRYSAAGWLLAHGVPLHIQGQPIALAPLAVTVFAAWRCLRAGRNTVRATGSGGADSPLPALAAAAAVGCGYGAVGLVVAAAASGAGLDIDPPRAALTLGVFGLVMSFVGGWARSRAARRWWMRLPRAVRDGVRTGIVGAAVLVACGAAAVGASVATSGSTATAMLRNMHLGFVGQAGIVLVCLAYAPNLAVWAAAYLAGPGFTLGGVPELPVFAGLPSRPVTGPGQALLLTPVLAGCLAGVLLARRRRRLRVAAQARAAAMREANRLNWWDLPPAAPLRRPAAPAGGGRPASGGGPAVDDGQADGDRDGLAGMPGEGSAGGGPAVDDGQADGDRDALAGMPGEGPAGEGPAAGGVDGTTTVELPGGEPGTVRAVGVATVEPLVGGERLRGGSGRLPLLGAAALAGPAAGAVVAAAGYLAAGALGSEALASTGQVGWEFAVIAGLGIAFGAMIGAFVASLRAP